MNSGGPSNNQDHLSARKCAAISYRKGVAK